MAQYEVTLRDYWRILRRRKGVVIFTAFLLGFFSFVLAQIWQPIPEYTANAKIQIESNQSIASLTMESYGYSVGDQIETKISVIQSYPVIRRAAEVIGMMEGATTLSDTTLIVFWFAGANRRGSGGLFKYPGHRSDRHQSYDVAEFGQYPRRSI